MSYNHDTNLCLYVVLCVSTNNLSFSNPDLMKLKICFQYGHITFSSRFLIRKLLKIFTSCDCLLPNANSREIWRTKLEQGSTISVQRRQVIQ